MVIQNSVRPQQWNSQNEQGRSRPKMPNGMQKDNGLKPEHNSSLLEIVAWLDAAGDAWQQFNTMLKQNHSKHPTPTLSNDIKLEQDAAVLRQSQAAEPSSILDLGTNSLENFSEYSNKSTVLLGGSGNNVHIFSKGSWYYEINQGQDGDHDIIDLKDYSTIRSENIVLKKHGESLVIECFWMDDDGQSNYSPITIANYFLSPEYRIEYLDLVDGRHDLVEAASQLLKLEGSSNQQVSCSLIPQEITPVFSESLFREALSERNKTVSECPPLGTARNDFLGVIKQAELLSQHDASYFTDVIATESEIISQSLSLTFIPAVI